MVKIKRIDKTRLSSVSPYDVAPKAVEIIRAIGEARVRTSPKLMNSISHLQDEFAEIRSEDDRIVVKLTKKLRAKYTYHTNSIEGNTLTESETRSFIETGLTVSGKSLKEYSEARNIPPALDMLIDMTRETKPLLKTSDILELHGLVVKGIEEPHLDTLERDSSDWRGPRTFRLHHTSSTCSFTKWSNT